MRVLFAGGGTGGHILPLKLVYEELKDASNEFYYVTKKGDKFREKFFDGIKTYFVSAYPYKREKKFKDLFFFALKNFWGVIESFKILKQTSPSFIITTGGYTSFPIAFACVIKKIKIYLIEGNSVPGLFTKFFARFKNCEVFCAFEETKESLKTKKALARVTGYPVKKEFLIHSPARENLITFAGGSQGSRALSDFILKYGDKLAKELQCAIFAAVGGNIKNFKDKEFEKVQAVEFDINIYEKMKKSKLVVLRAGANSVNETLYISAYSIFVPYPYASEDHQYYNARAVLKLRPGSVIRETEEEFEEKLYNEIKKNYESEEYPVPTSISPAEKIKKYITAGQA